MANRRIVERRCRHELRLQGLSGVIEPIYAYYGQISLDQKVYHKPEPQWRALLVESLVLRRLRMFARTPPNSRNFKSLFDSYTSYVSPPYLRLLS